jgi:foldase protein PrsA
MNSKLPRLKHGCRAAGRPALRRDSVEPLRPITNRAACLALVAAGLITIACQQAGSQRTSVTSRLGTGAGSDAPRNSRSRGGSESSTAVAARAPSACGDSSVACIDGRAISEDEFNELLVGSHGLFVLEQLLSLDLVEAETRRRGLVVTQEDVDAELQRSLIDIGRRVADDSPDGLRQLGERLLVEVLREKNVSRAEFMNGMRRNACLRKLVADGVQASDDDIQAEFQRRYGRKALARHIEVPSPVIAGEVRRQLDAGVEFSELAVTYSTNRTSAASGGLLAPFTEDDAEIPALMRNVVFRLQPGEVSPAVLIDGKHHLFRLERFLEPETTTMTPEIAGAIRDDVREKQIRRDMHTLENQLFEQARIEVRDPAVRKLFSEKYPEKQ